MAIEYFTEEVVQKLKYYVYRLIDPRNGETFYVGKGKGQRIFDHVKGDIKVDEQSAANPKLNRIHKIQALGMNVEHVIHRHGMEEDMAKEVEAALMDAYPGLVNRIAGTGSTDRGTQHVNEIVMKYSTEEFVVEEPLILISVRQLGEEIGIYEAVRGVWKLNLKRAEKHKLVLAHINGLVRGAYRPKEWMEDMYEDFPGRIGFNGTKAETEVWEKYVWKRVPTKYRIQGARAPARYLSP